MRVLLICTIVFAISFGGVYLLRKWILRKDILDIPNERSSHTEPTPRGGGLVIVLVVLGWYLINGFFFEGQFLWTYFVGGILIALVSWLDDLFSISSGWRILVHSLASLLVILGISGIRVVYLPFGFIFDPGVFGLVLTFIWIIWLTNAFNFMDGIDGIAGLQAVTAGFGWLLAGWLFNFPQTGLFGGVVACSAFGFLLFNWEPARIFMGDVGSAFLGYTLAVLPILAGHETKDERSYLPLFAVGLVWFFLFDAGFTLAKRLLRVEKVWEPHRQHFYQKLVRAGYSHSFVAGLYGGLSVLTSALIFICLNLGSEYDVLLVLGLVFFSFGLFIFSWKVKRVKSEAG
ncbi:MAG: glycosyltransferase family 4 protein [Pyrinomonadaceae bacterium]